ncbi:MAG TPA: NAD-binding protein, partial [Gemmataceae bacterium]|nr:NAD-binding protein [Gemmataceae bacterium]
MLLAMSSTAVVFTVLAGYPLRVGVLAGAALAQIGEFTFILADRGRALGLLDRTQYQAFLATAVLTVTITPVLIGAGPRLAGLFEKVRVLRRWKVGKAMAALAGAKVADKDHVVVIGYGLNGRNLARVLGAADVTFVVRELNPETVRLARSRGEPVYYGDCTRPAVLEHVGVAAARVFVVAISDPASSRRAVQLARQMNPRLHIIARTRYLSEVAELRRLGANAIIPEEFETSVEIFARVLGEYDVPKNLVQDLIERVRGDHYEVLRDVTAPSMRVVLPDAGLLEKLEIQSCWVRKGSPADGWTVGELRLRSATGATLVAVRRGTRLMVNPGPDHRFEREDTAYLVGDHPQVDAAMCLLDPAYGAPADGA